MVEQKALGIRPVVSRVDRGDLRRYVPSSLTFQPSSGRRVWFIPETPAKFLYLKVLDLVNLKL